MSAAADTDGSGFKSQGAYNEILNSDQILRACDTRQDCNLAHLMSVTAPVIRVGLHPRQDSVDSRPQAPYVT